ncbi:uncharacterized protein LOC131601494 [Vicia villosa]|uniref:uncharacterized protein LOC131601494 n=1 Tax=Vicia villosa TaxID=3911 RepID=UPI00273AB05E|nr:uncharacterized protein LOC131601494 [Vicia villosa]
MELESSFPSPILLDNCVYSLGEGTLIPFWNVVWLNVGRLSDLFPVLFLNSSAKDGTVFSMGKWTGTRWEWGSFGLDASDVILMQDISDLRNLIANITPNSSVRDSLEWGKGEDSGYTTKSGYINLCSMQEIPTVVDNVRNSLSVNWKALVPFRIKAFGWRCLIDRLPLKIPLIRRGVSVEPCCVLCCGGDEDASHLFLYCSFSKQIWREISSWLGITVTLEGPVQEGLLSWVRECRKEGVGKNSASGIWLTIVWCIWRHRNDIVFNGASPILTDLVWYIKLKLWKWLSVGNISLTKCNFYDFCKNPVGNLG